MLEGQFFLPEREWTKLGPRGGGVLGRWQLEGLGDRCKRCKRLAVNAKRFWCIFRLKSAHIFEFHNDAFVILLYLMALYNGDTTKLPWGCHNFLVVGAIAPMESAPMSCTFVTRFQQKLEVGRTQ